MYFVLEICESVAVNSIYVFLWQKKNDCDDCVRHNTINAGVKDLDTGFCFLEPKTFPCIMQ